MEGLIIEYFLFQPLSDQLHPRHAGPMSNFPCRVHLVFYFLKPSHFFNFHLMSCVFVLTRPLNATLALNLYGYQVAGNCISLTAALSDSRGRCCSSNGDALCRHGGSGFAEAMDGFGKELKPALFYK